MAPADGRAGSNVRKGLKPSPWLHTLHKGKNPEGTGRRLSDNP